MAMEEEDEVAMAARKTGAALHELRAAEAHGNK